MADDLCRFRTTTENDRLSITRNARDNLLLHLQQKVVTGVLCNVTVKRRSSERHLFSEVAARANGARIFVRRKVGYRRRLEVFQRGFAMPAFLRDKSRAPSPFLVWALNTCQFTAKHAGRKLGGSRRCANFLSLAGRQGSRFIEGDEIRSTYRARHARPFRDS